LEKQVVTEPQTLEVAVVAVAELVCQMELPQAEQAAMADLVSSW